MAKSKCHAVCIAENPVGLLSPEVKKTSKEQIKEKVKPSILARLERNKELAKQENEARRSEHRPHKKQNMEL